MAAEVGYAALGIYPSFRNFGRDLDRGVAPHMTAVGRTSGTRFGDASGEAAGRRFSSKFKTLAKAGAFAAVAGVAAAGKLLGDAVGAAADLGETTSKTAQIFGDEALPALQRFARGAARSLGQSEQAALDAVSTFGVFGKAAGLQGPKLSKFSVQLTRLASDLASFSNTSPEEAAEALGSALRGEAEPMRKYGVLLDEATLKAEALALGLLKPIKDGAKIEKYRVDLMQAQKDLNDVTAEYGPKSLEALDAQSKLGWVQNALQKATEGTIPPLTAQQKVLAANSAIFKQTADAQGDFARTSDGLANRQRALTAQWENMKVRLGSGLLPIVNRFAGVLLDDVIPGVQRAAEFVRTRFGPAFSAIGDFVARVIPPLREFGGRVLGALAKGWANFRAEIQDNGPFLRVIGDNLARIGEFMLDKVLPAVGAFASVTIPTAGKVLGKFIGLLQATAEATLLIAEYGTKAFRIFLQSAMTTFDGIVSAAAKGLGWMPGIGDKVKAANAAFDRFRNNTLNRLDEIAAGARSLRLLLSAPVTLPVNIRTTGAQGAHQLKLLGDSYGGARAMGGPVDPAHYYKVGERGPEYFRPTVPGVIETSAPTGAGVTVSVGQVVAHDYNDFMSQMSRRAHRASLEGRR